MTVTYHDQWCCKRTGSDICKPCPTTPRLWTRETLGCNESAGTGRCSCLHVRAHRRTTEEEKRARTHAHTHTRTHTHGPIDRSTDRVAAVASLGFSRNWLQVDDWSIGCKMMMHKLAARTLIQTARRLFRCQHKCASLLCCSVSYCHTYL